MDNKDNMNECMWMLMGSIHESNRVTVAKCLDMMEEKGISKEEMISNIESAKEEWFTLYNERINIIINELEKVDEYFKISYDDEWWFWFVGKIKNGSRMY